MLSIFAPHFFNWTEQLKDSGHEVYWLDIFDSNTKVEQIDFAEQITGWRYKWNFPGRYFLKEKAPSLTGLINKLNERNFQDQLQKQILRIRPDVVHSFVMYLAGVPALTVMKKFPAIKWVYTAWGSDMFYYQHQPAHFIGMKKTLPRINYMFSDCQRDFMIAKEHGFKGEFLGVFPGGGGFDFGETDHFITGYDNRKLILIKGYEGLHGKCLSVLEAIHKLEHFLTGYQIIIFGADPEVFEYIKNSPLKHLNNLKVKGKVPYQSLMELMGQAVIYIGNSSSDGMPNTLLEAIVMGAFPIQSNPGGATAEIIQDDKNGLLIEDPDNSEAIAVLLKEAVKNIGLRKFAVDWNLTYLKPKLERKRVREHVLKAYQIIEEEL